MTMLSICQAVAEELGLPMPSAIVGSADRTSRQLFRLLNREGRILAKRNWTILHKEHTFTTVNGTPSYALPADYGSIIDETAWDRDTYWNLRGPLSASEWQIHKSGSISNVAIRNRWRIKALDNANRFYIDPTPSSANDMVFEYLSSKWCTDTIGTTFYTAFQADSDVSLIPEELLELGLMWRFKNAKGLAYDEEYDEYVKEVESAIAHDGGAPTLNMGASARVGESRKLLGEGSFTL